MSSGDNNKSKGRYNNNYGPKSTECCYQYGQETQSGVICPKDA